MFKAQKLTARHIVDGALLRRDPQVRGAGVEDDGEVLGRGADRDHPIVLGVHVVLEQFVDLAADRRVHLAHLLVILLGGLGGHGQQPSAQRLLLVLLVLLVVAGRVQRRAERGLLPERDSEDRVHVLRIQIVQVQLETLDLLSTFFKTFLSNCLVDKATM